MRVNLGLQGAEFRHPEFIGSLFLAVHQGDDFFCHVVVGIGQHANLVAASVSHIHGLGRAGADSLHLQGHAYDAVRNGAGQAEGSVQGQGGEQQVNQGKMHHQRPARISDMEGGDNGHHVPVRVRDGKIGHIGRAVQIGDKGKRLFLSHPLPQVRAGNEVFPGQAHVRGGYDHIPLIYQEGSLVRDRGVIAQHHVKGRPGKIQGHIGRGIFNAGHSAAVMSIRNSGDVGQLSVLLCLVRRQVQFRAQQTGLIRSAVDAVPVAAAY